MSELVDESLANKGTLHHWVLENGLQLFVLGVPRRRDVLGRELRGCGNGCLGLTDERCYCKHSIAESQQSAELLLVPGLVGQERLALLVVQRHGDVS